MLTGHRPPSGEEKEPVRTPINIPMSCEFREAVHRVYGSSCERRTLCVLCMFPQQNVHLRAFNHLTKAADNME